MDVLYSLFFAAALSTFVYSKLGRRAGYDNVQSNWLLIGVVFIIAFVFFFTLTRFFLESHQGGGVVNP